MQVFMAVIHTALLMGTLALTFNYYGQIPVDVIGERYIQWLAYVVYIGVAGVSVVWALVHALGGSLMGIAAGGVLDGLKLGTMLGGALAIGRLWPYVLVFSLGTFLCEAPLWHTVMSFVAGIACFGIHMAVRFFWSKTGA